MQEVSSPVISARKKEIVQQFTRELDKHILELKEGKVEKVFEIRDFARLLFIHPVHLSNTIREVTSRSTCDLFEERLLRISCELLSETTLPISRIATQLTYDPSNFTKFFKHFMGITPREFRKQLQSSPEKS